MPGPGCGFVRSQAWYTPTKTRTANGSRASFSARGLLRMQVVNASPVTLRLWATTTTTLGSTSPTAPSRDPTRGRRPHSSERARPPRRPGARSQLASSSLACLCASISVSSLAPWDLLAPNLRQPQVEWSLSRAGEDARSWHAQHSLNVFMMCASCTMNAINKPKLHMFTSSTLRGRLRERGRG